MLPGVHPTSPLQLQTLASEICFQMFTHVLHAFSSGVNNFWTEVLPNLKNARLGHRGR